MEISDKLKILSAAAKYDVSCSSSGSRRTSKKGGFGSTSMYGICHSWTDDGRCISLLKILMSNCCIYDCAYCINRRSNDIPRASFTPDEVADLTINFYKRNYIEGLLLSSAVLKSPNYTMELLTDIARKLRENYGFNGYIHLKTIPGADNDLIEKAGMYADRMSVNIELPSEKGLKLLAPQKKKESILTPMNFINYRMEQYSEEKKKFRFSQKFVPAGQTTQLIVGATPDNDLKILRLSEALYNEFKLKRVYYSAYVPVTHHPNLPAVSSPPLIREHRLYQADWLLRFYGFHASEILNEEKPDFDLALDPKCNWALKNLEFFPVEINRVDYNTLLRVPGIGVKSARKIVAARRFCPLNFDDLRKLGIVMKRARYFITCNGKYYGIKNMDESAIRNSLIYEDKKSSNIVGEQLSMFSVYPSIILPENNIKVIGEEV